MMTIKQGDHKFYIGEDENDPKAEITFKDAGQGVWNIDHTYVSDEMRGAGIGGKLVEKVVNHARDEGMELKATCPFAKELLEKIPQYQDIFVK